MADRSKVPSPPLGGGLQQFTDPAFLSLNDFQDAQNVFARSLVVQKRTGYTHQQNVVSTVTTIPFVYQHVARNGSKYLFCVGGGTVYKLS